MRTKVAGNLSASQPVKTDALVPLLKWAGGKRWLVDELSAVFPSTSNSYYEPFLGGAAVFFALRPARSTLSDSNKELINCYRQVRDDPQSVLRALRKLRNTEADYYKIRGRQPTDRIERAARLLFLTTLSFNGIFRQNLDGVFNVPYGKKTHIVPADAASNIPAASKALKDSKLVWDDFETVTKKAVTGDIVYFDPPYTVTHGNNGFVKYNAKIFSWEDQIRLSKTAERLSKRGCFVFVSNADHPSIRDLYKSFDLKIVGRPSRIAAATEHRKAITECLFFNAEVIHAGVTKHR